MSSSRRDIERKTVRRRRRKKGIRKRAFGTAEQPRMSVFRSSKNIYCQVIDDYSGRTLASSSTLAKEVASSLDGRGGNVEAAKAVGKSVAEKALAAGVTRVLFDRNGYHYHGRVKALADSAREAGLKF